MFRNYLITAFRNMSKKRGYSFINITGLALGMACCLLIALWVMDELSYDRFHENARTLYRIEQDQDYSGENYHVNVSPYPMAEGVKSEIPEIRDATGYAFIGNLLVKHDDQVFFESGVRAVAPSFLSMFSFPLISGDAATALDHPHSVIMTEELARKYFGNEDPVGKTVMINTTFPFTVTGVMKNVPTNSFISFDMLVPMEFTRDLGRYNESWGSNNIYTYVQVHETADVQAAGEKITMLRHRNVFEGSEDAEDQRRLEEGPRTHFKLHEMTALHLFNHFGFGNPRGDIQYVSIFSVIAVFVLLIACINFMNLATARSAGRAKEVGLRKVVGAVKHHLIGQFFGEAILLTVVSLFLAILLVVLFLPSFNTISGKTLPLNVLLHWPFLVSLVGVTLVTGVIAGSYPALYLSAFQPVRVLKGSNNVGRWSGRLRKILVVIQFSLSIVLIIGTSLVYKQVRFMREKSLGYDKEHLIYISLRGDTPASYPLLKDALLTDPSVVNVTGTWQRPTYFGANAGNADWDGKDPEESVLVGMNFVDFDYVETLQIDLAEGRSFSKDFSMDTTNAFLVNEEVVKLMGTETAEGKRFSFIGVEGTIIGVMKNYHYQPVRFNIEPLALLVSQNRLRYAVIRLDAGNLSRSLDHVESTWNRVMPGYPFEYHFLDDDFDRMYRADERVGVLLRMFSILAILIASLGLFGLASFTAEQRTKEIGIRKALGASVPGVIILLVKEFTRWIILANLIAWPTAYLILRNWLQAYAYRTPMAWWVFAVSGASALLVAILTVAYQSIRAALANPVKSLRYE